MRMKNGVVSTPFFLWLQIEKENDKMKKIRVKDDSYE